MAKIPRNVMKYCMTVVHEKCGSPKKNKSCSSKFLKKCISVGRKRAKTFTMQVAKRL